MATVLSPLGLRSTRVADVVVSSHVVEERTPYWQFSFRHLQKREIQRTEKKADAVAFLMPTVLPSSSLPPLYKTSG